MNRGENFYEFEIDDKNWFEGNRLEYSFQCDDCKERVKMQ